MKIEQYYHIYSRGINECNQYQLHLKYKGVYAFELGHMQETNLNEIDKKI